MRNKIFLFLFILLMFIPAIKTVPHDTNFDCLEYMVADNCVNHEVDTYDCHYKTELDSSGVNTSFYLHKMGYMESRNNYTVVNRFGYMGKYQFGMKTLRSLVDKGLLNINRDALTNDLFIGDPLLQESAMMALTAHNVRVLRNYKLMEFVGKDVGGVRITLEGMLAAAHLRGPNSVRLFLRSNGKTNLTDGNGTSVKDYIKLMS